MSAEATPTGPDPLTVTCGDCMAPAGVACRVMSEHYTVHASRTRSAELRAVTHGTCDLCGAAMVHGTVNGVTDAWHPDPDDAAACPPIPDPTTDPGGFALAINLGLTPGHPGAEHFHAAYDPETSSA